MPRMDAVIDDCITAVKRATGVTRRVEFTPPSSHAIVSLVLCAEHLQVFFEQNGKCVLTGETFAAELCDWCHPEES